MGWVCSGKVGWGMESVFVRRGEGTSFGCSPAIAGSFVVRETLWFLSPWFRRSSLAIPTASSSLPKCYCLSAQHTQLVFALLAQSGSTLLCVQLSMGVLSLWNYVRFLWAKAKSVKTIGENRIVLGIC